MGVYRQRIAVQVNGTLRDVIEVDSNADEEAVKAVGTHYSDKVSLKTGKRKTSHTERVAL
ncbi:MAG TPA: hypothetical protein DCX37_05345 [Firmicutes bacterium]|nr:hypothetical protein [Bacillota bacterium]